MTKTIIACGGDIITDQLLHLYALAQVRETKGLPKVCLLPTASGDSNWLIDFFTRTFKKYPCEISHLSVFHPSIQPFRDQLLFSDLILCCGGHSKSALDLWKANNIDVYLKEAYENGTVIAGGSAGAVGWFDSFLTDSFPPLLTVMDGLGWIDASCCPHYVSRERRKDYKSAILEQRIKPGYAISDNAALHFQDGKVVRSISSQANHSNMWVYREERAKGSTMVPQVVSERFPTIDLSDKEHQEELLWKSPLFSKFIADESEQQVEVEVQAPIEDLPLLEPLPEPLEELLTEEEKPLSVSLK